MPNQIKDINSINSTLTTAGVHGFVLFEKLKAHPLKGGLYPEIDVLIKNINDPNFDKFTADLQEPEHTKI